MSDEQPTSGNHDVAPAGDDQTADAAASRSRLGPLGHELTTRQTAVSLSLVAIVAGLVLLCAWLFGNHGNHVRVQATTAAAQKAAGKAAAKQITGPYSLRQLSSQARTLGFPRFFELKQAPPRGIELRIDRGALSQGLLAVLYVDSAARQQIQAGNLKQPPFSLAIVTRQLGSRTMFGQFMGWLLKSGSVTVNEPGGVIAALPPRKYKGATRLVLVSAKHLLIGTVLSRDAQPVNNLRALARAIVLR
jgi:hypothetical protein